MAYFIVKFTYILNQNNTKNTNLHSLNLLFFLAIFTLILSIFDSWCIIRAALIYIIGIMTPLRG